MPRRLPRPDELIVEQRKVVEYLLNTEHTDGASKAGFFKLLGFDVAHCEALAQALKQHGRERDVLHTEPTAYGTKYVVRCRLHTPAGTSPCVTSVWIAEADDPPRLVTAYPHRG